MRLRSVCPSLSGKNGLRDENEKGMTGRGSGMRLSWTGYINRNTVVEGSAEGCEGKGKGETQKRCFSAQPLNRFCPNFSTGV